ncbi:type I pullulanase [Tissierella creatinini]|nr:type I pullulanase [Tissierella creatinini]TJX64532.1 type I pullulanase [Soehngenia saccharolytica]
MWFDDLPTTNKKLGMLYTPKETIFRVWSPLKDKITLLIYDGGESLIRESYLMNRGRDGVHELTIKGDLKGKFYTYLVDGNKEVTDPYSISSSMNSIRSAIIDLDDTNPEGWENHTIPYNRRNCDAIVYEVHVKDLTADITSGAVHRGKYLGFAEKNTAYKGLSTGLSHLKELGVTHVHIMPVADFITVREDKELFFNKGNYNWGYDPELYNTPEGSYATDPEDPVCRIKELKTMILALHESGLKVIIDVVYNHTFRAFDSNFNTLAPNYYYRQNGDGSFSNGSGVGNEIASERTMVRKFIIDSLLYWTNEYKVDGFRFDLMALIDIDTVEEAITRLREIKPDIFIYGEPWTGGITALSHTKTTTKGTQGNKSFALFNDNFRDALKGDNDGHTRGFIQGNLDHKMATETGIAGSIYYDDGHIGFASHPRETINYLNSHDNLIFADKLKAVFPSIDSEGLARLNNFAFSILLTSQGIPFMHAGNEFLRSKKMIHNTYNSDLDVNAIDWSLKKKNYKVFKYMKDLIELRMTYKPFRMTGVEIIKRKLKFLEYSGPCTLIEYTLEVEENNKYLLVIHNPNPHSCFITLGGVKDHIHKSYGAKVEEIRLKLIFDENGLVNGNANNGVPHGINVPHFSTIVYEIRKN